MFAQQGILYTGKVPTRIHQISRIIWTAREAHRGSWRGRERRERIESITAPDHDDDDHHADDRKDDEDQGQGGRRGPRREGDLPRGEGRRLQA